MKTEFQVSEGVTPNKEIAHPVTVLQPARNGLQQRQSALHTRWNMSAIPSGQSRVHIRPRKVGHPDAEVTRSVLTHLPAPNHIHFPLRIAETSPA